MYQVLHFLSQVNPRLALDALKISGGLGQVILLGRRQSGSRRQLDLVDARGVGRGLGLGGSGNWGSSGSVLKRLAEGDLETFASDGLTIQFCQGHVILR